MTPRQHRTDVGRDQTPPEHTPRLRLKPKAPQTGYVDGAWWPRSDDLTTELPDLLAVLSVRLGPIEPRAVQAQRLGESTSQTRHRRTSGTTRRIPTPAAKHRRSPRTQPQQDRSAGSPAPHRPRPRTRHHDGRGGPEQRLDRRRSLHGRRARQGNRHPDSCRARALGFRRRSRVIARRRRRRRAT